MKSDLALGFKVQLHTLGNIIMVFLILSRTLWKKFPSFLLYAYLF